MATGLRKGALQRIHHQEKPMERAIVGPPTKKRRKAWRCSECGDRLRTPDGQVFFSSVDGGNICPALSIMERDHYEPHAPV